VSTSTSPTRSTAGSAAPAAFPDRRSSARTRGQFAGTVGLGEVVVGAQVEAEEHVLLGRAGGEQQDRDVRLGAQDPAHVESVDQRQHHVEDDEVGRGRPGPFQRRAAVRRDLDRVALPLQVDADQPGLLLVVLRHQNPSAHRFSPTQVPRVSRTVVQAAGLAPRTGIQDGLHDHAK
jgi:hypothetical protein